jgi:hypothetical protein
MNNILNNKINYNIKLIISSYLLSPTEKLKILKIQNLSELLNFTYCIYGFLHQNHCYDNSLTIYYKDLINAKIVKDTTHKYWTIRKLIL